MKKLDSMIQIYWDCYLSTLDEKPCTSRVSASMAGNTDIADELLELYLSGKKYAGSGLVKDYEVAGEAMPEVGDFWIILDSRGVPRCIVRTTQVDFYRFGEASESVAAAEGEGDLSLNYWRRVHSSFFEPMLRPLGIEDLESAEIVTEYFELVYA